MTNIISVVHSAYHMPMLQNKSKYGMMVLIKNKKLAIMMRQTIILLMQELKHIMVYSHIEPKDKAHHNNIVQLNQC